MINCLKALFAAQDYAAREELSSNELSLLLAILRVYNSRRWPLEAQRIGNNELLSHCTFSGSARDKVLRQTREKLQRRGVITFVKGSPYGPQPVYGVCWEALGIACEPAAQNENQDSAQMGGMLGGMPSRGDGDNNININKDETSHTNEEWRDRAYRARARGDYADMRGEKRPCRFDGAWRFSPRARAAVAQRLLEGFAAAGGVAISDNAHATLCELMALGMPPEWAEDALEVGLPCSRWLARLRTYANLRGFTREAAEAARLQAAAAHPGLAAALRLMGG